MSRTFELFEGYSLKNVLILPEAFKLPHRPTEAISETDASKLDEEILQLMNQIHQVKIKNHQLKVQQKKLASEEALLSKLETQFDALAQVLSAHSVDSLSGTIATLNGQIESMKSIVADTLEASSNAFALDDGELPKSDFAMDMDPVDLPMDANVMTRLLDLEMKSCAAIGSLADIKALL